MSEKLLVMATEVAGESTTNPTTAEKIVDWAQQPTVQATGIVLVVGALVIGACVLIYKKLIKPNLR